MGYIDDILSPGEKIIARANLHWGVFVTPAILFFVAIISLLLPLLAATDPGTADSAATLLCCCAAPAWVLAISAVFRAGMSFFSTEFAVTSRRLVAKTGFIKRQSLELMLKKVETISINQDIMGRMLGYGSITVSGSGGARQSFPNISEPLVLKKRIDMILQKLNN